MSEKVTLVLDADDADLLAAVIGAGAIAWDIQGDDRAPRALALRDKVRTARRHSHRGGGRAGWQGA